MCGIAGIIDNSHQQYDRRSLLNKMIRQLNHRGPDGNGFYDNGICGLAHSRLSIIDLESGQQPIHNENKDIWVVFNGEIFNYIELRESLSQRKHVFYTHSDTEVIVHLYEEYGEDFVNYLNGQFAIAIWDERKELLILVRDRTGIAPLFYKEKDARLTFGSEIKAILPALESNPSLNRQALDQLFTFWAPVSPNTIFEGVNELSPGHMLVFHNGRSDIKQYWDWSYKQDGEYLQGNEDELAEELRDKLIQATRIRLRSDVPVAAYLSGGLDSSVLVSIIKNFTDTPLRTFSIEFSDKALDESDFQKELIRYLETDHSKIHCTNQDVAENFIDSIWHTEMPILRSAPVPMGMLSGLVHNSDYKVVLTGEGADEVLGGYDIFKEAKIRQFWAVNRNSSWRPLLLKRLYPYLDISPGKSQVYLQSFFGQGLDSPQLSYFSHIPRWTTTAKCKEFYSNDMRESLSDDAIEQFEKTLPANLQSWHTFNKSQYIESKSLMSGYLLSSQGDRMLMKNSVEGRFPFLDHNVIEFANQLHPKLKMKVLNEKYLLKKALGQYIPDSIVNRHKQPYRAPDIASFTKNNGDLIDFATDLLSASALSSSGYFDQKKVALLLRKIKAGRAIGYKDNMAFMGILSTQVWHSLFINQKFN